MCGAGEAPRWRVSGSRFELAGLMIQALIKKTDRPLPAMDSAARNLERSVRLDPSEALPSHTIEGKEPQCPIPPTVVCAPSPP